MKGKKFCCWLVVLFLVAIASSSYGTLYTLEDNLADGIYGSSGGVDGYFDVSDIWSEYDPQTITVNRAEAHFLFSDDGEPPRVDYTMDTQAYYDTYQRRWVRYIDYFWSDETEATDARMGQFWDMQYSGMEISSWPEFREEYYYHDDDLGKDVRVWVYDSYARHYRDWQIAFTNLRDLVLYDVQYNGGIVDYRVRFRMGDSIFDRAYLLLDIEGSPAAVPTPEPAALVLLAVGLLAVAGWRVRKRI